METQFSPCLHTVHILHMLQLTYFNYLFFCRYQIVVEIIHATTISSLPQLKKQKGKYYN